MKFLPLRYLVSNSTSVRVQKGSAKSASRSNSVTAMRFLPRTGQWAASNLKMCQYPPITR